MKGICKRAGFLEKTPEEFARGAASWRKAGRNSQKSPLPGKETEGIHKVASFLENQPPLSAIPVRSGMEKHWRDTSNAFRPEYRSWISFFWDVISDASKVLNILEGKKELAENCSYLLLTKPTHVCSMDDKFGTVGSFTHGYLGETSIFSRSSRLPAVRAIIMPPTGGFYELDTLDSGPDDSCHANYSIKSAR
jgi:hypothetical protein